LDKIKNSPESRKEWMLERFKLAAQIIREIKNFSFGNTEITLKKFTLINLCGQN
jgi:hypothetical protein